MLRVPLGDPPSQNVAICSPEKNKKGSNLSQLIAFLKSSGLNVPPNIAKIISQAKSSEKQLCRVQSMEEPKKLKLQISQLRFQLKKFEQDQAQNQRNQKIEKERELKKTQELVTRLRQQLELVKEEKEYIVVKMKQDHEQEGKRLMQKIKQEFRQEKSQLIQQYQTRIINIEKCLKREHRESRQLLQKDYSERLNSLQSELIKAKEQKQQQKQENYTKWKRKLEENQKRHESIRVALESEKKTEQRLHQKKIQQEAKQKQKLMRELCFQKNNNRLLEDQCRLKEAEIATLRNNIRMLEKDKQKMLQAINEQLKTQKANHSEYIKKKQQEWEKDLIKTKTEQQRELSDLSKELKSLHDCWSEREQHTNIRLEEMKVKFESRLSKKEDTATIEKLRWTIAQKEEEIQKLTRAVKNCNLELENKEDIYTRMFRGSSVSREKKHKQKQQRIQMLIEEKTYKELIYRKSQTSDIKHLLKHYNPSKFQ